MFGELDVRRHGDALFYPEGHPPERPPLEEVGRLDGRVVRFRRVLDRALIEIGDYCPGERWAPLEQRIVYHSPTGLEFGYGGSGPADTAINVLAMVLPPREAVRLHHLFKDEFISNIPRDGGAIRLVEVRGWVLTYYRAEFEDSELMRREHIQREGIAYLVQLDATAEAARLGRRTDSADLSVVEL